MVKFILNWYMTNADNVSRQKFIYVYCAPMGGKITKRKKQIFYTRQAISTRRQITPYKRKEDCRDRWNDLCVLQFLNKT